VINEEKHRVVTGTIGDDIHGLGMKIIERALDTAGFHVVPLGIQTPQEDFIKAAVEANASAILISSMSGHARMLCEGMRGRCIEAGLKDIVLYIGGKLDLGDEEWSVTKALFLKMGYDGVYSSDTMPGEIIVDLTEDLTARTNIKGT